MIRRDIDPQTLNSCVHTLTIKHNCLISNQKIVVVAEYNPRDQGEIIHSEDVFLHMNYCVNNSIVVKLVNVKTLVFSVIVQLAPDGENHLASVPEVI